MSNLSHWQIQISDPQRSYRSTKEIHVLAPEMIDAVNRVSELYPNARLYNCVHNGTFENDHYVRPKMKDIEELS
jgi:hypothetical protein